MDLPKRPDFKEYEPRIYAGWEKAGVFSPKIDKKRKPYTILLPPPNANAPLHVGHAMYVIEDILCRYHRMLGDPTLYLPGTDHAGIETQYVFENYLSKQGKSRFDYDRETLFQMINEFVEENRGIATQQLRRLGFSLDWTREKYTLHPEILEIVFDTFRKLHQDGLIYRAERLVNYCTYCGTGFSNLEINHIEKDDSLYYLDYQTITIATTRPETIFADVAVAVHPDDPRYQNLIGKTAIIPIINKSIPIIADQSVDPKFGTGALKITPAHDQTDFEIGERHQLPKISVIDRNGRLVNSPSDLNGLFVKKARIAVIDQLKNLRLLTNEEPLKHSVGICYRCKNAIEPLLTPQWYVKVKTLIEPVIDTVKKDQVKIFPHRFKNELLRWLETSPDWNISRQIVWGPRIPAWYCLDCHPQIEIAFLDETRKSIHDKYANLKDQYQFFVIEKGLQNLIAPTDTAYMLENKSCEECGGNHILQETDTFDTWFSSGQWPLTTLGYPDNRDFKYFYPTRVLDTMWDILAFWVMRMLMFGIYRTGQIPFETVHLHARVLDNKGQKMSKSKGNVTNPIEVAEKYGADVLRMALVFGVAPAADVALGEEKFIGMRNFVTKLWNISRFVLSHEVNLKSQISNLKIKSQILKRREDQELILKLNQLVEVVTQNLNDFQFSQALENLYDFTWNEFASKYLEDFKNRSENFESLCTLHFALLTILKLLHPFIPFVTEEIYQKMLGELLGKFPSNLPNKDADFIAVSSWPKPITS